MGSVILALAGGWSAGLALAGLLDAHPQAAALLAFASLVAAVVAPGRRMRQAALTLAAGWLGVGWAGWWAAPLTAADPLERFAGAAVVRGRVVDAPTPRGERAETILLVEAVSQMDGGSSGSLPLLAEAQPRVLLRASALTAAYGDLIEVRGQIARPRSRPGWPLAEILARRGIRWTLDAGYVRVLEPGAPGLLRVLNDVRAYAEATTRRLLPEPNASLLAGIVFGARAGLPADLRADLTTTGTSHLTAVSGQNVALVAGALTVAGVWLIGRGWVTVMVAVGGVWLYTLLVGAPPSALRAATMATVALVVQGLGRQPDTLAALTLATGALLAWEPGLAFDIGFQLSVTATAGLVLLSPTIEGWLSWLPRAARGWIAVAVAAQLATMPIILGTFQRLSLVSLPANVLAAPLVPPIMVVGALVALFGRLPVIDGALGAVAWALTETLLIVIERSADVPGALVALGRAPAWLPLVWYGLLLTWIAAGSADLRSLGIRPPVVLSMVVAGVMALIGWNVASAVVADHSSQTVVVILDAEPPAALVRGPDGRTSFLTTGEVGPGVVAGASGYLEFWEHRIGMVIGPDGLRRDVDLLALGQVSATGTPRDATESARAPDHLFQIGDTLPLGDNLVITVVDVRRAGERPVLDLVVQADGLAIVLPGPGEPSDRWPLAAPDAPLVARLPRSGVSWARTLPPQSWLLLIGDAATVRARGDSPVPLLLAREYGAVELTIRAGSLSVRSERCQGGRDCQIELPPPAYGPLLIAGPE